MNKLFLFIFILGLIILFCFNKYFEKFTWAYGYYPKPRLNVKLPKGSWKETCVVKDYRHPFLWAQCKDDHGKFIETSIDAGKCFETKIKNVKGTLECE
jgi:hypothetical protein